MSVRRARLAESLNVDDAAAVALAPVVPCQDGTQDLLPLARGVTPRYGVVRSRSARPMWGRGDDRPGRR